MTQLSEPMPSAEPGPCLGDEEIKHLSQANLEQSKGYTTAVLLVAGAALTLSMTAFTKLGADPAVTLKSVGWLKVAWVLLGAAMVAQVFAVLTSMHAIRKTLRTGVWETSWAGATEKLNWVIAVLLVLGLAGLMIFAFHNVG